MTDTTTDALGAPRMLRDAIRSLIVSHEPLAHPASTATPWGDVERCATRHRCWPLVTAALGGAPWPYGPDTWEAANEAAARNLGHCLHLDRTALWAAERLRLAGIPHGLTKGVAFAQLLWPDPAWRSYSDVDLVVPRRHLADVVDVLVDAGCERHGADPASPGIGQYAKGVMYATPGGVELDLHMNLCDGPYAFTIHEQDLLERTALIQLGGVPVDALGRERLFLHACLHAVLPSDHRRLIPTVDVSMGLINECVDPAGVTELARRWGIEAVAARAITSARAAFDLPRELPLVGWAERARTRLRDRRWLWGYRARGRPQAVAMTTAKLEAQPDWARRGDYLRMLLRPVDGGVINRLRRR